MKAACAAGDFFFLSFAPQAGAGSPFLDEKKRRKDSPKALPLDSVWGTPPPTRKRKPPVRRSIKNAHSPSYTKKKHTVSIRRRSFLERSRPLAETCSVASFFFLLRAAKQNLTCNLQRTGLFPVRKTDAERELTRIPKAEPLVVERESKGRESILSLWKAFAYFHPFVKVGARPGMRGKACASRIPCALAQNFFKQILSF